MNNNFEINQVSGRLISVKGNDIDTDRIIPARFLKCLTFTELGPHAFEDDRQQLMEKGEIHPFDEPKFSEGSLLVVNKNFGCGSSREHAPQSLMRWGINAIIGESFAEIFFGNCTSLGIPCVTAEENVVNEIMDLSQTKPDGEWTLNLSSLRLEGTQMFNVKLSAGTKNQFLEGKWNPMGALLENLDLVALKEKALPYRF